MRNGERPFDLCVTVTTLYHNRMIVFYFKGEVLSKSKVVLSGWNYLWFYVLSGGAAGEQH